MQSHVLIKSPALIFVLVGYFVQYLQGSVEHRRVIQHHQAAIGSRLQVDAHAFAILKIMSSEEVADGIYAQALRPNSSAIRCMLPVGKESLILRSSLNVIVLIFIYLMVSNLLFCYYSGINLSKKTDKSKLLASVFTIKKRPQEITS